ncbi:MAG: ABC transporter permease, partial [Flavobacteriales bacterium]
MFDRESWGEVFESIGKNKLRAALTGFAVLWGILMLIVLLGLSGGLAKGFSYNFRNTATNSIHIWGNETSKPWNGLPPNREIILEEGDVEALRHAIPGIEHISGQYRVWRGNTQLQRGKQYGSYSVRGVMPEWRHMEHQAIKAGRFLNEVDQQQGRKVMVIAQDAKADLFKGEDPIGQWVQVNGIPFQVVGLYEHESGGPEQGQRSAVYIPLKVAQQVFDAKGQLDDILFTFSDASVAGAKQAQQRAVHVLARRHGFDPTDERALWVRNNVENLGTIGGVLAAITAFGWFVGIGSLFAGIVGIGNIMLIVVQERTREIGIRKALGATPANIVGQVMLEALFVTTLFGFFGLAGGVA